MESFACQCFSSPLRQLVAAGGEGLSHCRQRDETHCPQDKQGDDKSGKKCFLGSNGNGGV